VIRLCLTTALALRQGACSKASGSIPSIRRDVIGVGAECSPVPSVVDGRSLRTWSAVDKATETEQEDTENDDVPLSGLLQCTRRDVDDAQVTTLKFLNFYISQTEHSIWLKLRMFTLHK